MVAGTKQRRACHRHAGRKARGTVAAGYRVGAAACPAGAARAVGVAGVHLHDLVTVRVQVGRQLGAARQHLGPAGGLGENITALQAILISGGFKESAKSNQIVVFRRLNDEYAEVRTLDLKSIKKTSDLENDMTLRSGDIVFVPRNTLSKIERIVRIAALVPLVGPLGSLLR